MKITIVDYGMGNLFSVYRAVEMCGYSDVSYGSTPSAIREADRLILPGVGAFKDGMQGLKDAGLINTLQEYADSERPILGICLGAQMLASSSDEFGLHVGLDLIPGKVTKIPVLDDHKDRKLPFIGWTTLDIAAEQQLLQDTCLRQLASDDAVYLVHSYHLNLEHETDLLATYDHGGVSVTAAFKRRNITGLQFHPEKSGAVGLRILSNFLA